MIVDIYTHIFPERFFQELERGSPKLGNMGKRLRSVRNHFVVREGRTTRGPDFRRREKECSCKFRSPGKEALTYL